MNFFAPSTPHRARFGKRILPVLLLVLFFVFAIPPAHGKVKSFTFDRIAADQEFDGGVEVQKKAEEWLAEAKSVPTKGNDDPLDKIVKILNDALSQGVGAYMDPDGKVHAVDGHHKMAAARIVMKQLGIPDDRVKVGLDVLKDFQGDSWEKYVRWREAHDPIYIPEAAIPEAVRKDGASFARVLNYYKSLPPSIDGMKDLPMRSAMGSFFDALSLKGTTFSPAIQFRLGDKLQQLGIKVEPGQENSPQTQNAIMQAMFKGDSAEALQKFLLDNARPEKRAAVESQLRTAKALVDAARAPVAPAVAGGLRTQPEDPLDANPALFSGSGSANDCPLRFSLLGQDVNKLPERIHLPKEQADFASLLGQAQQKTMGLLDIPRLKDIFQRLSEGEKISGKEERYLIDARRAGLILRSSVKLLGTDDSKAAIKPFRRFVRGMGELDDQIWEWNFKGKVPKSLRDTAKDLAKALEDKELFKEGLDAKTPEQFAQFQHQYLGWMQEMLNKKNLTVGEYHDLRKAVRDYRVVVELNAEKEPKLETIGAGRFLHALSKKMGAVKDGLLIPTDRKKAEKFLDTPTQIDPDTKQQIQQFLDAMQDYLK